MASSGSDTSAKEKSTTQLQHACTGRGVLGPTAKISDPNFIYREKVLGDSYVWHKNGTSMRYGCKQNDKWY